MTSSQMAHIPAELIHHQRMEVDQVCLELARRFDMACASHPRQNSRTWAASASASMDPLGITTRLLSDTLARLKVFLTTLDPMQWLSVHDQRVLYNSQLCTVAILRAATCVNLETLPAAYPLPYGEYLGEVEALHLILAHDLYNGLRSLIGEVQGLEIREFPVMLLMIMVGFFTPLKNMQHPEKVAKVHDYYLHKLQVSLSLSLLCTLAPAKSILTASIVCGLRMH